MNGEQTQRFKDYSKKLSKKQVNEVNAVNRKDLLSHMSLPK